VNQDIEKVLLKGKPSGAAGSYGLLDYFVVPTKAIPDSPPRQRTRSGEFAGSRP
jgi:hypothetical protein